MQSVDSLTQGISNIIIINEIKKPFILCNIFKSHNIFYTSEWVLIFKSSN